MKTNTESKVRKMPWWRKELDDVLLDFCVNKNCKNPEEHKGLKQVVRTRLEELLTRVTMTIDTTNYRTHTLPKKGKK